MKLSLRNKFLIPIILLVITGLGISTAVTYFVSGNAVESIIKAQMIQTTDSGVKHLSSWIRIIRTDMARWSDQNYFKMAALDTFIGKASRKSGSIYLEKEKDKNAFYESLNFANTRGEIIASSDMEKMINLNVSDQQYFKEAVKGIAFISDIFASTLNRKPVFLISSPVKKKERVVGVLFGTVNLEYFSRTYIDPIKVGEHGYAYMLNRNGFAVIHPDKSLIMNIDAKKFDFGRKMLSEEKGVTDYTFTGMKKTAAFKKNQETGWLIVVSAEYSDIMTPVKFLGRLNLIITAVLIILMTLLIFFVVKVIVRPISQLRDAMQQMQAGELGGQIRIERQDEIGDLSKSFNEMSKNLADSYLQIELQNHELQRLDKLKDDFLANTSHELRTPLNGIIGITDSLIDGSIGPLTKEQRYNLSLIGSSGRRLTNLVNDILDFSKLKHRDIQLQLKPLDMRSIADVVLRLSRPLASNKNIKIVNQIPSDIPAAKADENRVQQILHNLIGNAIKFTNAGTVSVSAEVIDEDLAITVSDTGIGIPEESLDRIFRSFEQADGSTAREYGGTGLGLTITRDLVKLHGGHIRADSKTGNGSHFTFTLPVSGDKAEPLHLTDILTENTLVAGISADTGKIEQAGKPDITEIPPERLCNGDVCRILAVDDEPVNLQVLKNQLASEYYSVTLASDGREALAALESGQEFDLVLLDVMMPGMSGYEVCQRLRENHPETTLPVLMLTAKNQVEDLVAGFDSGASDFLTKPFAKQELIARISTHVMLKHLHASRVRTETDAKLLLKEMELARHIQTALLPVNPKLPGYEITASIEPADDIGGDYYDIISVAGQDWIIVGDVAGHGVPAGLVMMMVQTAIHAVLMNNPTALPSSLLASVNSVIYKNIKKMDETRHMTIVVFAVGKDGEFSFSGLHEDIMVRRTVNGKVDEIETRGSWVGLEPDISDKLKIDTLVLEHGDYMVLFTDGITEARCEYGMFGNDRLINIIEGSKGEDTAAIHGDIIKAVKSCKKPDDVTLLVIKRL